VIDKVVLIARSHSHKKTIKTIHIYAETAKNSSYACYYFSILYSLVTRFTK